MKKTTASVMVLLALLFASPLLSHDFWLIPNALHIAPGEELVVRGQTSSDFPSSLSAVTVDRVASAKVITAGSTADIEALDVSGESLHIRHRSTRAGQAVVAVAIHPRNIPESAESFRRYLSLEGAPEALERYEREGILPTDSIVRRYAKYAKTFVEVGSGGPRAFDRAAGHPLEFMPLSDPASSEEGGAMRFRLLFSGSPLPHARGHASVAESAMSTTAYDHAEFETDANGEFTLPLTGKGLWNVRALYILPAPSGSGADWDVHWATLVWGAG